MKINSTSNYSQFLANPKQRRFRPAHVQFLAAKMKANGFQPSMAISVYRGSDKGLVLNNGHHRLAAAKTLGIPVLYVIESEWTSKQLVDEGTAVNKWQANDSAALYAAEGNKDYVTLLEYVAKGITMKYAAAMLRGDHAATSGASYLVASGTFKVKTTAHINKVLQVVNALKDRADEATSATFIAAVSALIPVEGFSVETLIKKIQIQGGRIDKAKTRDQMLQQLEEVYNYKSSRKDNIAFKANERLRKAKATFGKSYLAGA